MAPFWMVLLEDLVCPKVGDFEWAPKGLEKRESVSLLDIISHFMLDFPP